MSLTNLKFKIVINAWLIIQKVTANRKTCLSRELNSIEVDFQREGGLKYVFYSRKPIHAKSLFVVTPASEDDFTLMSKN